MGINKRFSVVAAIMPPNTVVPTETRPAAPAPVATISGTTPRINASEVIRIGRSRIRAASIAASIVLSPSSCSCSANSTIKIAFLLESPISITRPICAYTSLLSNDVYAQIGLVMLIGLSSKNAILIVEFAEQLQDDGLSTIDAAVEAARIRLRPILMTSLAFILGVVPLMVATGAGAAGRVSVGTTVFGGMIAATTLNLLFIPMLYVVVRSIVPRRKGRDEVAA